MRACNLLLCFSLLLSLQLFATANPTIGFNAVQFICSNEPDGTVIPDPFDCSNYYLCLRKVAIPQRCAFGLSFDTNYNACNFADLVDCNASGRLGATTTEATTCAPETTTAACAPETTTAPCAPATTTTTPCAPATTTTTPCATTTTTKTTTTKTTTTKTTTTKTTTVKTTTCAPVTTTTPCAPVTTTTPCAPVTTTTPCAPVTTTTPCAPVTTTTPCAPETTTVNGILIPKILHTPSDCMEVKDGTFLLNAKHCRRFWVCYAGKPTQMKCPSRQWFDFELNKCRNRSDVTNCPAQHD